MPNLHKIMYVHYPSSYDTYSVGSEENESLRLLADKTMHGPVK